MKEKRSGGPQTKSAQIDKKNPLIPEAGQYMY